MREVTRQFREGHPLVQMIQRCLKNRMRERPSIQQLMGWLEEARAEVQDGEYDANKLSLAQLLHSRNQQQQQLQIDQKYGGNRSLREQIGTLHEQNESLQAEIVALKQSQEVCVSFVCLLQYSFRFPLVSPGHTHSCHPTTCHFRSLSSLTSKTTLLVLVCVTLCHCQL